MRLSLAPILDLLFDLCAWFVIMCAYLGFVVLAGVGLYDLGHWVSDRIHPAPTITVRAHAAAELSIPQTFCFDGPLPDPGPDTGHPKSIGDPDDWVEV